MATHCCILAWRILWTGEPGGLLSTGSLSRTRPKRLSMHALEKEMAPDSSVLAWKNPMDGGAWWAAVHGVVKSRT